MDDRIEAIRRFGLIGLTPREAENELSVQSVDSIPGVKIIASSSGDLGPLSIDFIHPARTNFFAFPAIES